MFDKTVINVTPVVVKAGDMLVITTPRRITRDQFDRIKRQIPDGVSFVLLEDGCTVEAVVSK